MFFGENGNAAIFTYTPTGKRETAGLESGE